MKNPEQPDRSGSRILKTVEHAIPQINTVARPEFAGRHISFEMKNPVTVEDVDSFLVRMQMEWGFARWNPADELRHLPASQIGMGQVPELAVGAGADHLAIIFVNRTALLRLSQFGRNVAIRILRATGAHDAQRLQPGIFDRICGTRRNINGRSRTEFLSRGAAPTDALAGSDVEHFLSVWVHHHGR